MKKEYDIFISYRREGGKEYARNLTSELVSRGFHPFLDFDELKDGKFDKRITDAIESAPVFMFILSPGSLDRCVNENDWVRKEILHAIEHNRHIVPVDIDKQFEAFPSTSDFPQEIKEALGQHQFSQIQTETLYKVSIDEMVKNRIQPAIDEYMRKRQKAAGTDGAEIHIETDMDCHVQRFHRDMIIAKVNEENVIHLPKGKHKLQFIAVENPEVKDSCEYKVEDVSESDFIEVFLMDKASVVSVESEELEALRKDKDSLAATIQGLQLQLDAAKVETQQVFEQSKIAEGELRSRIDKISQQLTAANNLLAEKERRISSLEKSLSNTEAMLNNVKAELKRYKDAEAKRKAEEEEKRKAEEEKKRGMFNVGDVEFKMIRVDGGTFTMGATPEMKDAYRWEKPTHKVTLSSYRIGETPVTQKLWQAVMGSNPSCFKGEDRPVENVSWDDCQVFIDKLREKVGAKFRLPTEAEWEFAARGGNKSMHTQFSGSNNIDDVAWYNQNSGNCNRYVMMKKSNELGIYDMTGNVWEWCQDVFEWYDMQDKTDPKGPTKGSKRVFRGGSWCNNADECRISFRNNNPPDVRLDRLGLRLALSE